VPQFPEDGRDGVYRVTAATLLGPYPGPGQVAALRARGVTHILNVASAHSDLTAERDGFAEVLSRPVEDFEQLMGWWMRDTLDHMHRMLTAVPDARLFVHCHAGQQRAPTILWLYLAACGLPPGEAAEWIRTAKPDASPGHRALVTGATLDLALAHGAERFQPLARPDIIAPVAPPRG
jgi:predicted protein tyrosine phosphatase